MSELIRVAAAKLSQFRCALGSCAQGDEWLGHELVGVAGEAADALLDASQAMFQAAEEIERLKADKEHWCQIADKRAERMGALVHEREQLEDKIEGLEADLFCAVQTAYRRGATEWALLNYPQWAERLQLSSQEKA